VHEARSGAGTTLALPRGVRRVRLPMPRNPLREINGYLLEGDAGYVLVDCGFDDDEVLDALRAALTEAGVGLEDVRTLVVTHHHADHYGLAGTLVRLGRLRLMMHRLDWLFIRTRLTDVQAYHRSAVEWLQRNGLPPRDYPDDERRALEQTRRFQVVAPHEELDDGARIPVGAGEYEVIWTPGHTPGHICLFDSRQRLLLSGDHVLDPITPSVSYWRPDAGNPLGDYLASLGKVADLDAELVLPAHGEPFTGLRRRVDELRAHHAEREAAVLDALAGAPAPAAEVAARLPWTRRRRRFGELSILQQEMAVSETLSHLEELRARRLLIRFERGGQLYWRISE